MKELVGIYLPADQFHWEDYPVCLYESLEEAEADLPRIQKSRGYRAFIRKAGGK